MHQPPCAPLSSGNPQPHLSSPLPFCPPQLLKPALTPRLSQIHLLAPSAQGPGSPSLQNLLPGPQHPHPNPLGHRAHLCPCYPRPRSQPRMALPRPQALYGDWLAGSSGGLKVGYRLQMTRSPVPKGTWMWMRRERLPRPIWLGVGPRRTALQMLPWPALPAAPVCAM